MRLTKLPFFRLLLKLTISGIGVSEIKMIKLFSLFFVFLSIGSPMASQICDSKQVIVITNGSCPSENLLLKFEDNFENGFDSSEWMYTQPWGNHSVKGTSYSIEYFTDGKNY